MDSDKVAPLNNDLYVIQQKYPNLQIVSVFKPDISVVDSAACDCNGADYCTAMLCWCGPVSLGRCIRMVSTKSNNKNALRQHVYYISTTGVGIVQQFATPCCGSFDARNYRDWFAGFADIAAVEVKANHILILDNRTKVSLGDANDHRCHWYLSPAQLNEVAMKIRGAQDAYFAAQKQTMSMKHQQQQFVVPVPVVNAAPPAYDPTTTKVAPDVVNPPPAAVVPVPVPVEQQQPQQQQQVGNAAVIATTQA